MDIDSFPKAENSIPPRNVDLPPHDVFVATVCVVGENSYLIENPIDLQTLIKEEFLSAEVKFAETEEEAKMRLDCKVMLNPVDESKVHFESSEIKGPYSSIVVKIQLSQEDKIQPRQPRYYSSGICIEPNGTLMAGIENCLKKLLQQITKKKDD